MRASPPSLEWDAVSCPLYLAISVLGTITFDRHRYAVILTPTFSPKFGTTRYIPGWRVVPGSQRPACSIGCEWVKKNLKDSDNGRKRVHRQPPRRKTSS